MFFLLNNFVFKKTLDYEYIKTHFFRHHLRRMVLIFPLFWYLTYLMPYEFWRVDLSMTHIVLIYSTGLTLFFTGFDIIISLIRVNYSYTYEHYTILIYTIIYSIELLMLGTVLYFIGGLNPENLIDDYAFLSFILLLAAPLLCIQINWDGFNGQDYTIFPWLNAMERVLIGIFIYFGQYWLIPLVLLLRVLLFIYPKKKEYRERLFFDLLTNIIYMAIPLYYYAFFLGIDRGTYI